MLITKEVHVKLNGKNYQYYKDLGYEIPYKLKQRCKTWWVMDYSKPFIVKVEDLLPQSTCYVDVQCDYCGKIIPKKFQSYTLSRKTLEKDACDSCKHIKAEEINLLLYGVKTTLYLPKIRDKIKNTNIKKYGVKYYTEANDFWDKVEITSLEKYGTLRPNQSDTVKEKIKKASLEKFGVEYPMQSEEVKLKLKKTLYESGNIKSSMQQRYINNLLKGELNYPFKYYNLDIAFPKEKIYIEYDGSGHLMRVHRGVMTLDQFQKEEIKRRYSTYYKGWNEIRIISVADKIPKDNKIIEMLNLAKEYFNTNHSWIIFDIDSNLVRTSQYEKEYDYGELRKIKKVDLKEDTSEFVSSFC